MINHIAASAILVCLTLHAPTSRAGVIFSDDFDPIDGSQWTLTSTVGARGNGIQGFDTGNALHFAGFGVRQATTIAVDVSSGGTIEFDFRGGNEDIDGNIFWEDVDAGENAVVEYSTDGVNFTVIDELDLVQFRDDAPVTNWLTYSAIVPAAAQTAATRFRWRQLNHSGFRFDEWAIDNVSITTATPEPSTWILIGLAGCSSVWVRRRRRVDAGELNLLESALVGTSISI